MDSQGSASGRRSSSYLLACALGLGWAGTAAVLLAIHGTDRIGRGVSTAFAAAGATFAFAMTLRAATRLRGRQQRAWFAIAGALGVNLIGAWGNFYTLAGLDHRFADSAFFNLVPLAALPFAAYGTAQLISTYIRRNRMRTFLGALVVAMSVFMVAWVVVLRSLFNGSANRDPSVFAQPMADVAYATIVVFLLIRARSSERPPLVFFLTGLFFTALADFSQNVLSLNNAYGPGDFIDIAAVIAPLFIAMASAVVRPVEAVVGDRLDEEDALITSILPYAAVVLAAAAAGFAQLRWGGDGFLAWSGISVMIVLSSRQFLALLENRRLAAGLRQRSTELEHNQEQFTALLNHSSDVIIVLDEKGMITVVRGAVHRVLGRESDELVGHPLVTFLHSADRAMLNTKLDQLVSNSEPLASFTFRILERVGSWRSLEAVASNLLNVPSVRGIILNTRDVTERLELEEQLRHQAFHDPLTGLANRALLQDRLEHALARNARGNQKVSLVLLDLDDFKTVNDSLGHAAGDELLSVVAQRLVECLRASDTAARLGGDEFAVLLEDGINEAAADGIIKRLMRGIERPILIGDSRLVVRASAGVATAGAGASADDVLRRADVAMYQAKSRGKGQMANFDHSMEHLATERLRLHGELTRALERNEFFLAYQPIVSTRTGAIDGVEALVRWQHPERGLVPPMDFIPAAEETGMIVELSRFVFNEAFRQARIWHDEFGDQIPLVMSVNVSARHLATENFMRDVMLAIDAVQLAPSSIILELTESALLADLHNAINRMSAVRQTGIRIALDDFGTGYSSLGYLKDLPVDIVKIDRSFITDLGQKQEQTELVRAIQAMSRSLKLETVAEGVEHAHQVDLLCALGVEKAQGFHFSRPVEPEKITAILRAGPGVAVRDVQSTPTTGAAVR